MLQRKRKWRRKVNYLRGGVINEATRKKVGVSGIRPEAKKDGQRLKSEL